MKKQSFVYFFSVYFLLLMIQFVEAKVIYVDTNAQGSNDGTSWVDAYPFLQDGLSGTAEGDEIRVAQGTYTPDQSSIVPEGTKDRNASFVLTSDLTLVGGYAGSLESDPNVRDYDSFPTILSGDLEGNDEVDFANYEDNSSTILFLIDLTSPCVLDGFTITGGNADGSISTIEGRGAGIYAERSSFSLRNCLFSANMSSGSGGGVYSDNLSDMVVLSYEVNIDNCIFAGNSSRSGGAIYFSGSDLYGYDNSSLAIKNSFFKQNRTLSYGGGALQLISSSNIFLLQNIFLENQAPVYGGAIGISGCKDNFFILQSTFIQNSNSAIYNNSSNPHIVNCKFIGNHTIGNGGAIQGRSTYADQMNINCTFYGNSAGGSGGGIYGGGTFNNCIFWGNSDKDGRTEISQIYGYRAAAYNCIEGWTGNLPGEHNFDADPLFVDEDGADDIMGNEDDNLQLLPYSPCIDTGNNTLMIADYMDLNDNGDTTEPIPYDLSGNGRFYDLTWIPDNGTGTAPIIDLGCYEIDPSTLPPAFVIEDLPETVPEGESVSFTISLSTELSEEIIATVFRVDGDSDIQIEQGQVLVFNSTNYSEPHLISLFAVEDEDFLNGTATFCIDSEQLQTSFTFTLQEIENEAPQPIYVDMRANGEETGFSWQDAFPDLQDALLFVRNHPELQEIRVAQGVYLPTQTGDQTVSFELVDGLALKGSYAGISGDDPNIRDYNLYQTILSGDLQGDDIFEFDEDGNLFYENRTDNSRHIVIGELIEGVILDGFRISRGHAREIDEDSQDWGGGVFLIKASAIIKNCIFSENLALRSGAGASVNGDVKFENCIFERNGCHYYAGRAAEGSNYIKDCVFRENNKIALGVGGRPAVIENCTFIKNKIGIQKGGISDEPITIKKCRFDQNQIGIDTSPTSVCLIEDCLFENHTNRAIFNERGQMTIVRSEFFDNNGAIGLAEWAVLDIKDSLFEGNHAEEGGGIYLFYESNATITNCVFVSNSARYGGAIYSKWSEASLLHCTLTQNRATFNAGGIYQSSNYSMNLDNCILWGNEDSSGYTEVAQISADIYSLRYNCIQGWTGAMSGTGNFDSDPLFKNPDVGNWNLQRWSPCIDTGFDAGVYVDIKGDIRPWDYPSMDNNGADVPEFDIGAYEFINGKPISNAGKDIIIYAWEGGLVETALNGTASYDSDGDELEYFWYNDSNDLIATGAEPNILLPVGEYMIDLIVNDGLEDSEPNSCIVSVIETTEVPMNVTPLTLNCRSQGNWIKAHFALPAQYTIEDIDTNRPAVIHSYGFESALLETAINKQEKCVEITASFDHEAICSLAGDWPEVFRVYGFFTDGSIFFGESGIRINPVGLKEVSELAMNWMGECGPPKWCEGMDLNRDTQVNLKDYPLLLNSEVEFIVE